jgi:hypothetical protein
MKLYVYPSDPLMASLPYPNADFFEPRFSTCLEATIASIEPLRWIQLSLPSMTG